jgi:hypothetical protein
MFNEKISELPFKVEYCFNEQKLDVSNIIYDKLVNNVVYIPAYYTNKNNFFGLSIDEPQNNPQIKITNKINNKINIIADFDNIFIDMYKCKIYCDENCPNTIKSLFMNIYLNNNLLPITLSIPENKILCNNETVEKNKIISDIIPTKNINPFITEEDYYNEYRQSFFAITKKLEESWDSLKHYEIIACGSIPYFINLNLCPHNNLIFYPKDLIIKSNKIFEKLTEHNFADNVQLLNSIINELVFYLKNNLTTKKIAEYILLKINNNIKPKILFLTNYNEKNYNINYLQTMTLHGFKELLFDNCHDFPKLKFLYKNYNSTKLENEGFTYSNLLDEQIYRNDKLDETIIHNISDKYYDYIIYGDYESEYIFYDYINKVYEPNKIIFLSKKTYNTKMLEQGHYFFVNDL